MMTITVRLYFEGKEDEFVTMNRYTMEFFLKYLCEKGGLEKTAVVEVKDDCLSVSFINVDINGYLFLRNEFHYGNFINWDEIEVIEAK